jgi:hypothetical protein
MNARRLLQVICTLGIIGFVIASQQSHGASTTGVPHDTSGSGKKLTQWSEPPASIPKYAVRLGSGAFTHNTWELWVFGSNGGQRCWGTKSVTRGLQSENVFCGLNVPPRSWQLIAKTKGGNGRLEELFFVTKKNVRRLKVLVKSPGKDAVWATGGVHSISGHAATEARLGSGLDYARVRVVGSSNSVVRVVATG